MKDQAFCWKVESLSSLTLSFAHLLSFKDFDPDISKLGVLRSESVADKSYEYRYIHFISSESLMLSSLMHLISASLITYQSFQAKLDN